MARCCLRHLAPKAGVFSFELPCQARTSSSIKDDGGMNPLDLRSVIAVSAQMTLQIVIVFLGSQFVKIVRPYGDSRTAFEASNLKRQLHLNGKQDQVEAIEPFAHDHPELVIAQWISTIDKIATKPTGTTGATQCQRDLRTKLGDAAWRQMMASDRLSAEGDELRRLEILWSFKVHPYGEATYRPRKRKDGSTIPEPSPRGRWYDRLVGDTDPEQINPSMVAAVIEEHLYKAAKRLKADLPDRRQGHIQLRSASIAGNTVKLKSDQGKTGHVPLPADWSDDDERVYFRKIDVAKAIYDAAIAHEENSNYQC